MLSPRRTSVLSIHSRFRLPLDRVSAGFHYVRTGETVLPEHLPDRAALAELLESATPL